jgi:hypothetical protein
VKTRRESETFGSAALIDWALASIHNPLAPSLNAWRKRDSLR